MGKIGYTQLASDLVRLVGGRDNIISVTNCMTRLRFVLKDENAAKTDEIKAVKDVKGVVRQGGQYQIIIGTHVNTVIADVKKEAGILEGEEKTDMKLLKEGNLFDRIFKIISGCIMPMIGVMVASGMIICSQF